MPVSADMARIPGGHFQEQHVPSRPDRPDMGSLKRKTMNFFHFFQFLFQKYGAGAKSQDNSMG
jgi:hypothetical protein